MDPARLAMLLCGVFKKGVYAVAKSDLKIKKRMLWIVTAFLLFFLLLAVRVGWIQLVKGEEYKTSAFRQQTRDSLISAERGSICDRNGKILAQSATAETVSIGLLN